MQVTDAAVGAAIGKALSGEVDDLDIERLVSKLSVGDVRAIAKIVRMALKECGVTVAEDVPVSNASH